MPARGRTSSPPVLLLPVATVRLPSPAAMTKARRRRVNRPHRKTGRPRKVAPPNAAARIEALAASGHSIVGIARGLSLTRNRLQQLLEDDPAIAEALARGRESEEFALHNVLFRAAMKGNIIAAIYLTKARFGWREGDQSEIANKVSITFALPGAMKPEDFLKVIEHEQTANSDKPIPAARLSRS
jgi:hypothetical protein